VSLFPRSPSARHLRQSNRSATKWYASNRAGVCDSITLLYPAGYKDYLMILFLQGDRKVFGFSGRSYFDSVDYDTKVMVDHVYSPGGEAHISTQWGRVNIAEAVRIGSS